MALFFDELELRSQCSNDIYRAAKRSVARNDVLTVQVEGSVVKGLVKNDDNRHVSALDLSQTHPNYWCTCENTHRFCEHLIATGLTYLSKHSPGGKLKQSTKRPPSIPTYTIPETTLSRYQLGLSKKKDTLSLFIYDNQTKQPLSTTFLQSINYQELIQHWPYPSQRNQLIALLDSLSAPYLLPNEFYPLHHYSKLDRDFFQAPIVNENGVQYEVSNELLDYQLRFKRDQDLIKLIPEWQQGNQIALSFRMPLLLNCSNPVLLTQSSIFFLKQPNITSIVPVLEKKKHILFDIKTFNYFRQNQIPRLREQGLTIAIDPDIQTTPPKQLKPTASIQFRWVNDTLFARVLFHYKNRKISQSYAQPYLFTNQQWVHRDTEYETSCLKWVTDHSFTPAKNLYAISDNALYAFLFKYNNTDLPMNCYNPEQLNRLFIDPTPAEPNLVIAKTTVTHLLSLKLEFTHPTVTISGSDISQMIINQTDFFKKGPTIIAINHKSILDLLPKKMKIGSSYCKSQIDIGLCHYLTNNWPNHIHISADIAAIVNTFNHATDLPATITPPLESTLYPYQVKGYRWLKGLYNHQLSGILADEMGLGKTIQTLCFIQSIHQETTITDPILIVMPTTLIFNWADEINRFTPELTTLRYEGTNRHELLSAIPNHQIVLCSYAILRRDIALLRSKKYHLIILDEAQAIKNYTSKTTHAVLSLAAQYRMAITGTPIENYVQEIWSLFNFLNPNYFGSYASFKQTFETPIKHNDSLALEKLRAHIDPFILRRVKSQIELDLPPKKVTTLYSQLSPDQQDLYAAILNEHKPLIQTQIYQLGFQKAQFHIFSLLTKLRQICCHPGLLDPQYRDMSSTKLTLLMSRIKELCASNHKIVIFSQFISMFDFIENSLNADQIPYVKLTGKTKNRQAVINQFNTDPSIQIFLMSLKAGGVGINLTAADYVFHYDPWWNPAVESQASDRVHRIGQTKPVFIYKMITTGTLEEKIHTIQASKRQLYDKVLNPDGIQNSAFLESEINELLDMSFRTNSALATKIG